MTLSQFLTRTSHLLRGIDDEAPTFGGEEAVYWLDTLNRKKDELYQDVTKNWSNAFKEVTPVEPGTVSTAGTTALTGTGTYFTDYLVGDQITVDGETVRTIDTITSDTALTVTVAFSNTDSGLTFRHDSVLASGVQQYNLHRSFLSPSNKVYITTSTEVFELDTIPHVERNADKQSVFISDADPQILNFSAEIESTDPMIGGVITLPGYYMPDDLTLATDVLPFLDPNWAVLAVATEIAGNDIVYEDKEANLNTKANALYNQMVKRNKALVYGQTRKVPTILNYKITSN